ncbi:PP_RS20740 family protein [Dermabacteraceae bacterium P13128]
MLENKGGFMGQEWGDLLGGPTPFPDKNVSLKSGLPFKPWHKPRKQYIRRKQWALEVDWIARKIRRDDAPLRYLTLPGRDFLDIRYISSKVYSRHKIKLKYLGFDKAAVRTGDQSGLNNDQHPVNRLECIDRESEVLPVDFREIARTDSSSYRKAFREPPFHVINLDLCDGFADSDKVDNIPTYFEALDILLDKQKASKDGFVLFITTRMDRDCVDEGYVKKLHEAIKDAYGSCEAYACSFMSNFNIKEEILSTALLESMDSTVAFMLGLVQWIVYRGNQYGHKASVRSFMTYRTGAGEGPDDIVSFAIRFTQVRRTEPDPYNVIQVDDVSGEAMRRELCEQSKNIPDLVNNRTMVDKTLNSDENEFMRCLGEVKCLLAKIGYDGDGYEGWAYQEYNRKYN